MRPKDEPDAKVQTGTFILSEKIDDTKSKRNEKDLKKELKRQEKERLEREKRDKKAREKEKEREKQAKKGQLTFLGILIHCKTSRLAFIIKSRYRDVILLCGGYEISAIDVGATINLCGFIITK